MNSTNQRIVGGMAGLWLLCIAPGAWAHCEGNHTGNHPHCQGAGQEDPVFTAESLDPDIPPIDSYSVFQETTVTFRHAQLDLSGFEGTEAGTGSPCDHGVRTGTFTIKPAADSTPDLALFTATFQSELVSGKSVTHVLRMEGLFDEPANWPPGEADPSTTVSFDYWSVEAENNKAQRDDCAGESGSVPDPDGPWTVVVTRQP